MTTKADTSVKWFHSGMADAPVLRGEAGALIELLDACLINGFSTRSPDSVVVAGGVATVSISAGNPYDKHAVIAISGASEAALNAEWRIDTSAASSFTFLCPGVADGTVTGAVLKRAGAGWGKPFVDTNVAVYQSLDPASTQLYLRVNDADARYTRVRGYEQMTDANTGTGLFPTLAQLAESGFTWAKSDLVSAANRAWALAADGRLIYFFPAWCGSMTSGKVADAYRFGDFVSFAPSDGYSCCVAASGTPSPSYSANSLASAMALYTGTGCYLARGAAQAAGAMQHLSIFPLENVGHATGVPVDTKLHFAPVYVADGSLRTSAVRGALPGFYLALDRLSGITNYALSADDGTTVMHVQVGDYQDDSRYAGVDVGGPWR